MAAANDSHWGSYASSLRPHTLVRAAYGSGKRPALGRFQYEDTYITAYHYISVSVLILREFAQLMAAANDPHWDAFFQQGFEPQVHTQFAQLPTTTISVPTTTISVRRLREFAPRSGKMQ
jgi:hypothetical protein